MWRATVKGILGHKLRLALTVLAITIGVGFVTGSFVFTDTLGSVFDDLFSSTTEGTDVTIRPIRPEDAEIEQDFIRNLSDEAKYFRFMHAVHELTPEMLVRFTQIDYDREMALIAVTEVDGHEVEHGVVRYVTNPDQNSCEFALVISDEFQGHGIGQRMLKRLMEIARSRGLDMMEGEVLTANHRMLDLVRSMDFQVQRSADNPGVQYVWTEL